MPRGEKIYCQVRISDLSRLFNRKAQAVRKWIKKGYLDPSSLKDILEKLNDPSMLDKRRKRAS